VTGYCPMTLADLAGGLARTPDVKVRWELVGEFPEEYRRKPADTQPSLLNEKPARSAMTGGTRCWRH
jgi:hypothetical protein